MTVSTLVCTRTVGVTSCAWSGVVMLNWSSNCEALSPVTTCISVCVPVCVSAAWTVSCPKIIGVFTLVASGAGHWFVPIHAVSESAAAVVAI